MSNSGSSHLHNLLLTVLIAGCGGNQDSDTPAGGGTRGTIGPQGGAVSDDSGAQVSVPEGALQGEVAIGVAQAADGFTALPTSPLGPVYALTPHGTEFALPVTIRVPHDAGRSLGIKLYTSQPGGPWTVVDSAVFTGEYAEAELTHFSYVYNGVDVCGHAYQECCTGAVEPCAGELLRCDGQLNVCLPCGVEAAPCCADSSEPCGSGLVCSAESICSSPATDTCGQPFQACCSVGNRCASGMSVVCDPVANVCLPCGGMSQPCCDGNVCLPGLSNVQPLCYTNGRIPVCGPPVPGAGGVSG